MNIVPMIPRTITEIIRINLARQKNVGITNNLLISVRIPTHNRSDLLLKRALASALSQTYKKIEIVIVGDYCTDDTEEVLRKIESPIPIFWQNLKERNEYEKELLKDPEIRWFIGPVRATNRATELCSGDWIAHIDDDDTWTKDHIQVLLDYAIKGNYEFVSGDYIAENNGKRETRSGGCQTWLYRKYVADIFKYDSNCWKKKWDRVSDIDVYERMKSAGVRMGHLDKIVAYVLPRPGENTIGLEAYKKYESGNGIH